jgi:hypothetical protein
LAWSGHSRAAPTFGGHHDAHRLGVLDGLFRKLGRVPCFQILFISRPSGLDANHRPLDDEDGGQLTTAVAEAWEAAAKSGHVTSTRERLAPASARP